jgi:mannuronan 5-epimerase
MEPAPPIARLARLPGGGGRGFTAYAVVFLAVVPIAALLTLTVGRNHGASLHSFVPVPRPAYIRAPDPIDAVEQGLPPTSTLRLPKRPNSSIRAIQVFSNQIRLLRGGQPFGQPIVNGPYMSLETVANLVGNPDWIAESKHVIILRAALIVEPGARLDIEAPETTMLHLEDRPGVFLGIGGGTVSLRGITVDSEPPGRTGVTPARGGGRYRPFILARLGGRLTIAHSRLLGLGYDWNGSYGVSWMAHAAGQATGSTFERGFIGVYTDHVDAITLRGNTFRRNQLYGLDPHSYSSRLLIERNRAVENAGHGIILSNHVHGTVVRQNFSSDNGENGIMIDGQSSNNLIQGNIVEGNRGDGIVLSDSPANDLLDNQILRNRVGLHATGDVAGERLEGNRLAGNGLRLQGIDARGNVDHSTSGSEGGWRSGAVRVIWLAAGALLLALELLTWLLRRRRPAFI